MTEISSRLIGQHVAVTESGGRLLVADTATGEILASHVLAAPGEASVLDEHYGGPRPAPRRAVRAKTAAEKAFLALVRTARKKVEGLPAGFRYHDLRHYFASLLIAHGADVKTVQARLRHGSAKTTLDTYGHLWPDKDESTKAVIDAVVDSKFRDPADSVRTERGAP